MGRHTRFEGIVRGMVEVLDCPLTVKMRTGIYKKNWNAHKLIPKLREWGVSMATVRLAPLVSQCAVTGDIYCRFMDALESSAIPSKLTGHISSPV